MTVTEAINNVPPAQTFHRRSLQLRAPVRREDRGPQPRFRRGDRIRAGRDAGRCRPCRSGRARRALNRSLAGQGLLRERSASSGVSPS